MSRKSLKKKIKEIPRSAEFDKLFKGLHKTSDHAAAIMGAALVDAALEKILVHHFKAANRTRRIETNNLWKDNSEAIEKLFNDRGALSDFHSKILFARALNHIYPELEAQLEAIRVIRNAFAHSRVEISFDTPEITDEIKKSVLLSVIDNVDKSKSPSKNMDNKSLYLFVVQLTLMVLDIIHQTNNRGEPIQRKYTKD